MGLKQKIQQTFGISALDTIYKTIVFKDLFIVTSKKLEKKRIQRVRKRQEQAIQELKKKDVINVVFFLQNDSIWKYDKLYWKLKASPLFHPTVVVSPFNVHLIYDKQECFNVMKKAVEFAKQKNYEYICSYDFDKRQWINVKKLLQPDIIFFPKPYKDTLPKYHLYNFQDKLTLYAPYGICCIDIYRTNYDLPFNNLLWKFLVETDYQKGFAETYSLCKGDNALVVGALGTEDLVDPDFKPKDVWKPQDKPKKKIIWAPHHTVDYLFNFSNFLVYCDQMLELAERYRDQVQFAFKPHPVLKFKLINLWGKEKTEQYYQRWQEMENTQLEEGYYMDLFSTSDALIHDCASFTAEYLYTQKPLLFMVRDPQVESHWNTFGRQCYDCHYHAHDIQEIEQFIDEVVIQGNDPMKEQRENFFKTCLAPEGGQLPSQNIYDYLVKTIQ